MTASTRIGAVRPRSVGRGPLGRRYRARSRRVPRARARHRESRRPGRAGRQLRRRVAVQGPRVRAPRPASAPLHAALTAGVRNPQLEGSPIRTAVTEPPQTQGDRDVPEPSNHQKPRRDDRRGARAGGRRDRRRSRRRGDDADHRCRLLRPVHHEGARHVDRLLGRGRGGHLGRRVGHRSGLEARRDAWPHVRADAARDDPAVRHEPNDPPAGTRAGDDLPDRRHGEGHQGPHCDRAAARSRRGR